MNFSYQYLPEAYLERSQTYTMELFGKIVKGFKPLTISAKNSIVDVRMGSKYTSTCPP